VKYIEAIIHIVYRGNAFYGIQVGESTLCIVGSLGGHSGAATQLSDGNGSRVSGEFPYGLHVGKRFYWFIETTI